MTPTFPILYSFRRCPYAMRARVAIVASGQRCELREIILRDKPQAMLQASAKGTVPVLIDVDNRVIDESLDIMRWALDKHDPQRWLSPQRGSLIDMLALIEECDGPFKYNLDRYKYADRYRVDRKPHQTQCASFLTTLEQLLAADFLFGDRPSLADMAIAPFVRQFAHTDMTGFKAQAWPKLQSWLDAWERSEIFATIMVKVAQWQPGNAMIYFPSP